MRIFVTSTIIIAGITIGYFVLLPSSKAKRLPFYNPTDLQSEMVDSSLLRKGYGHTIGDFKFQNQEDKTITRADVAGKVFVAEYFFTTCGTICPIMNQQMMRVQKAYQDNPNLKILSFTVDPDVDDVKQMKMYADGHGADPNQWYFLTGTKEDLYGLARKSFFILKPAEAENLGDAGSDFIHTNNFVLVDQKLRIRGYYDGTSVKEVDKLIKDIELLF
jgi:protein SCO1/2